MRMRCGPATWDGIYTLQVALELSHRGGETKRAKSTPKITKEKTVQATAVDIVAC